MMHVHTNKIILTQHISTGIEIPYMIAFIVNVLQNKCYDNIS